MRRRANDIDANGRRLEEIRALVEKNAKKRFGLVEMGND